VPNEYLQEGSSESITWPLKDACRRFKFCNYKRNSDNLKFGKRRRSSLLSPTSYAWNHFYLRINNKTSGRIVLFIYLFIVLNILFLGHWDLLYRLWNDKLGIRLSGEWSVDHFGYL